MQQTMTEMEKREAKSQVNILEVRNLKKYFPIKSGILQKTTGHIKAVDGINLEVKRGETLGIVGESGCGKSTMGRTLIRLYEPTEGEIIFNGNDITHLSESQLRKLMRKQMQMIFQDPFASLNPRKTLGKILLEPLKTHQLYAGNSERSERVAELLEIVGLNRSFTNRYPHEFSGGQRQRIGIARALALQPDLIIADEAVSALDVSIQAQIINLMEDLQEEFNLTYIFISHDLSVVRHIASRVGVMYLGNLVELANKEDIYMEPLHPYTKALLSAVPMIRKKDISKRERIVLEGDLPSPSNPPEGCVFHTRCPAKMDICREIIPTFKDSGSSHFVACHLYG
jgi:oligopeptide/dipeptide ABC transporter ATP-binding protein